jgi:hypothetical protein
MGRTLRNSGIMAGMGSKGDPCDNASVESCISTRPGYLLAPDGHAVAESQLGVDPRNAVRLIGVAPHLQDPPLQPLVGDPPATRRPALPRPVALPRDVQPRAQPGDSVVRPLLVDQLEGHGSRPASLWRQAPSIKSVNGSGSTSIRNRSPTARRGGGVGAQAPRCHGAIRGSAGRCSMTSARSGRGSRRQPALQRPDSRPRSRPSRERKECWSPHQQPRQSRVARPMMMSPVRALPTAVTGVPARNGKRLRVPTEQLPDRLAGVRHAVAPAGRSKGPGKCTDFRSYSRLGQRRAS